MVYSDGKLFTVGRSVNCYNHFEKELVLVRKPNV